MITSAPAVRWTGRSRASAAWGSGGCAVARVQKVTRPARWAAAGDDSATSSRPSHGGVHLHHPGLRHLPPARTGGAAGRAGRAPARRTGPGRAGQDRAGGADQRRRPDGGGRAAGAGPLPAAVGPRDGRDAGTHHAGRAPLLGGRRGCGPGTAADPLPEEPLDVRRPADRRGGHRREPVAGLAHPARRQDGAPGGVAGGPDGQGDEQGLGEGGQGRREGRPGLGAGRQAGRLSPR